MKETEKYKLPTKCTSCGASLKERDFKTEVCPKCGDDLFRQYIDLLFGSESCYDPFEYREPDYYLK
jgi:hypothetical protein